MLNLRCHDALLSVIRGKISEDNKTERFDSYVTAVTISIYRSIKSKIDNKDMQIIYFVQQVSEVIPHLSAYQTQELFHSYEEVSDTELSDVYITLLNNMLD